MRKIKFGVLALVAGILALSFVQFHTTGQGNKFRKAKNAIPDRYIVVLEEWSTGELGESSEAAAVANELSLVYGGKVKGVFKHALNGYVTEMKEKDAEAMSNDLRENVQTSSEV